MRAWFPDGIESVAFVLWVIALSFACGLFVSADIGAEVVRQFRREAVERGHAEWVTDADGKATWRWKGAERP